MWLVIQSIIVLISSFFLLNAQLRIARTIFPEQKQRHKILGITLLMGLLVASWLLAYMYVLAPFLKEVAISSNIFYMLYILLIWGIFSLLFAYKKQWRLVFMMSTATVLTVITWFAEIVLVTGTIGAIVIKSTGEEVLKTAIWQSASSHNNTISSDIILYSILSWLGFAIFENIVYFIQQDSLGIFFVRTITTSLLHGIFTWLIWYVLMRFSKVSYIGYVVAYICGITLHAIYNIWLNSLPLATWIIFTIWWYFLLSYLLFRSDRLYLQK